MTDRLALFVCPMLSETAARMIFAGGGLPGVRLAVVTQDPESSAPEWMRGAMSAHWQVQSILDTEQLIWAIDGVSKMAGAEVVRVFGAYEQAQVPIAEARERLGIPGMSSEVTRNFRDKARMKDILHASDIPCARHALVESVDAAVRAAARIGYPVVVKPPAGAGALSTYRVESPDELRAALALAPPSPDQPAMLEEFVLGAEHSIETISLSGEAVWHSVTRYAPTPLDVVRNPWIQWCVLLPREAQAPEYDDIKAAAADALRLLGMTTGLTRMEWFRRPDGSVAIGEVAARPPGAQITTMISRANDIDFLAAWARVMILDEFMPPVQRYAVGAAFLRGQGTGRVRAVHGIEAAEREVAPLVCDYKLPYVGQQPTGSYEGEGFIIVRHAETAVVERALERIVSLVRVELE
jgi:biotin carboxylase